MSKIELSPLPSGFATTAALNARLDQIEGEFNDKVLYRDNPEGEPNTMANPLDMAGNPIINLPDGVEDHHPISIGQAEALIAQEVNEQLSEQMLLVGTGNVIGPLSAESDQVALFDGITGKLLKAGQTMAQYFADFLITLYNIFPIVIPNVSALSSITAVAGRVYELKEYNVGTGKGGGQLIGKVGAITPNNITTFAGLAGTYFERINYDCITPYTRGAIGDKVADDTAAVQAVIDYCTLNKIKLRLSKGSYRTTAPLTIPQNTSPGNAYGITIEGDGSSWNAVSEIYAEHTGAAILNLKGANGCSISGVKLSSAPTTYPKCALVAGRDVNVDSCGWHNIRRVWIDGKFSVSPIYSIASEENIWSDIFIQITGGGAKYGFYSCTSDALAVNSLPASSNIANSINRMHIWNHQAISDSACVYLECGEAMGSWTFTDCYCIPKSGSYYQINMGAVSATAPLGGFSFINCGGEIYAPVSPFDDTPDNVFNITSSANLSLKGLTILGGRGQLINAGGTRKILNADSNVTLIKPNVVIAPLEDPTTGYSIVRSKVIGGVFDVANSSSWIPLTFLNTWANSFGTPYAPASFQVDNSGTLRLRGTVDNSGAGVGNIAQLPPGFEPEYSMFFPTQDGAANAKISVLTSGIIQLNSGTGTAVDLSTVIFKLKDA
jgi:hypothetical protein